MSEDLNVQESLESRIEGIVARALPRTRFQPEDDLFDLGLTSLGFVRVIAELNAGYGTTLNGSEIGDIASVRSLSRAIARATANTSSTTV